MKVSVIVPCYNVENYITECIQSIAAQTHGDLEVICVDDGSTDGTLELLKSLKSSSTLPIQVVAQNNRGASSARNHGIALSAGDYLQFLDADDLLAPTKIAHQLRLAKTSDFPAIVVGSFERVDPSGAPLERRLYKANSQNDLWLQLMKTDLGITSSNLFKATLFSEGIRWNEEMPSSQEYDLMFQVLKKTKHLAFDPEILTHIRVRESGSISQTNIGPKWERYVQLRADILDYIRHVECESLRPEHIQVFFECIRMLYPHNSERAKDFFKAYIPAGFVPQLSEVTGKSYLLVYKLFGFGWAERIRSLVSNQSAQ